MVIGAARDMGGGQDVAGRIDEDAAGDVDDAAPFAGRELAGRQDGQLDIAGGGPLGQRPEPLELRLLLGKIRIGKDNRGGRRGRT